MPATNRSQWSVAKIVSLYLSQWRTEGFDQDRKEHPGYNAYRMRRAEANVKISVFAHDQLSQGANADPTFARFFAQLLHIAST